VGVEEDVMVDSSERQYVYIISHNNTKYIFKGYKFEEHILPEDVKEIYEQYFLM
jgi:hypothetical protein